MKKRKIYVASSWRNNIQPVVVDILRKAGHEVYDFRNPPNNTGFHFSEVDENWQKWEPGFYRDCLLDPLAIRGFKSDYSAMEWADTCVMIMPCGRSAHIESAYFNGAKKDLFILIPSICEPELMYKMADLIFVSIEELEDYFNKELKVYRMNEYEWFCDTTVEEAKKNYLKYTGVTVEEAFEGGEPDELTDEELDKNIFVEEPGDPDCLKKTFRKELVCRTEPGLFASTEY